MIFSEYLEELSKVEILERENENVLWHQYKKQGNAEARNILVESYQPLVFKLAMQHKGSQDQIMDMLQEGTIGLIEAVEGYEPERGIRFSTYAQYRIRGRILNLLSGMKEMNLISLDQPISDNVEEPLLNQLTDDEAIPLDVKMENQFIEERLMNAFSRLPEKERQIINAMYIEDENPRETAERLEISISYFYRLQKKAIRRMRGMLANLRKELKET